MRKKIIFSLLLTLYSGSASLKGIAHKASVALHKEKGSQAIVYSLIDNVQKAKNYWIEQLYKSPYNPFNRTFSSLFATGSYRDQINEHLEALTNIEITLTTTFAELKEEGKEQITYQIRELVTQTEAILKEHGIPSNLQKNWLKYSMYLAGGAAAIYFIKQKMNNCTVFECKTPFPIMQKMQEKLASEGILKKPFTRIIDDTTYILTSSEQTKNALTNAATSLLQEKNLAPELVSRRSFNFSDLDYLLKNKDGIYWPTFLLREFFIDPIKNIYDLLTKPNILEGSGINIKRAASNFASDFSNDKPYIKNLFTNVVKSSSEDISDTLFKVSVGWNAAKLIPATIVATTATPTAGYMSYKAIVNYRKKNFTEPLKTELRNFYHFLRKNAENQNTKMYKGMYLYFMNRIKSYLPKILQKNRYYFEQDILDLESNSLSFESKLTILSGLINDTTGKLD